MIKNKQRLNHNLLPYLRRMGDLEMFDHPAYVCLYFSQPNEKSHQNAIINNKVNSGYSKFNDARRSGAYFVALSFIDPSHQVSQFLRIKDEIQDSDEYWKAVKALFDSHPRGSSDTGPWLNILKRPDNPTIETEFFYKLPDQLTIYQAGGLHEFGTAAMRWTLSKSDALRDVEGFGSCELKVGMIDKSKVLYVHSSPAGCYLYVDSRNVKKVDK
ncbi:TPA: hypothetical protein L3N15_004133 [Vibrio parahaemolyticus]|uniref:hypothetical protein n=1 Tax=Vibrio parahaemolyticus TaxID=670 RepID=UPI0011AF7811|nr:hypothetical protein [Vibrio parahaemolyticus]HBN6266152.1 hypothetical protein [Vibrio parahaemolyticus]